MWLIIYHQTRLKKPYPDDFMNKIKIANSPGLYTIMTDRIANGMRDPQWETLEKVIADKVEFSFRRDVTVQKKDLLNLLNEMLDFSAESRIKPEKILEHPFLVV